MTSSNNVTINVTDSEDSIDQLMNRVRKDNQLLFKQVGRTREREKQLAKWQNEVNHREDTIPNKVQHNEIKHGAPGNISASYPSNMTVTQNGTKISEVSVENNELTTKRLTPPHPISINVTEDFKNEYQSDEMTPMLNSESDEFYDGEIGTQGTIANSINIESKPKDRTKNAKHEKQLQRSNDRSTRSPSSSSPLRRSSSKRSMEVSLAKSGKNRSRSSLLRDIGKSSYNKSVSSGIHRMSEISNSSSLLVNHIGKSASPDLISQRSDTPTKGRLSPIMEYTDSSVEFNDLPQMEESSTLKRIKVSIRMRPPHPHESISKHIRISPLTNVIQIKNKQYRFDSVFGPSTQQETVYSTMASELIRDVSRGINATLLAYGQTGAGKTYTTLGILKIGKDDGSTSNMSKTPKRNNSTSKSMLDGVVPRAIKDLFSRLNEERDEWPTHRVWVSYMQIYMEVIYDLLSSTARSKRQQFLSTTSSSQSGGLSTTPTQSTASTPTNNNTASLGTGLAIREEKGRIYVEGLSKHRVQSFEDVMKLLDYGERARMTAQTKLNQESSRSHTLFQIHVERRHKDSTKVLRSTFTCCDLAGSERQTISHEVTPEHQKKNRQFEEAKFINLSLSALGNVIHTLQANKKNAFIPWRDSKLTRVLQPTLSGNSKVHLIVNIGPDESYLQESMTSIAFGHRAMHVSLRPQINEEVDFKFLALSLQKQLDEVQSVKNQEILELVERNQQMEEELENMQSEYNKLQLNMQDVISEMEKYSLWYQKATEKNQELTKLLKKRKDRISHLDKFVNQLAISGDGEIMWGDQVDASTGGEILSPSRIALLDKDLQDFITKERKHLIEELQTSKEKQRKLMNKLSIEEKNNTSLNETIAYLTVELEKANKISESVRKRFKSFKNSSAHIVKDLKQLDVILQSLNASEIIPNLPDVSNISFTRLFPDRKRQESFNDSLLFIDDDAFSLVPVEAALSSLLEQILEREKVIEILIQQTRVYYAEEIARRNLEEVDTILSQSDFPSHGPITPVKAKALNVHNSIRKAASLNNTSQVQFPNVLKQFQRWNIIQDSIEEAKEKLGQDSFFFRIDFSSHNRLNLQSISSQGSISAFEQTKRSILDPFTQIVLNIEHKYNDVKDQLEELKDALSEKDIRIEDLENISSDLSQKNQVLSKQARLDQEEKSQLQHQINKMRATIHDLEKLGDLSKQNLELTQINRDLEQTNSKLEEQLHTVQEKLSNDTSYPRKSMSPERNRSTQRIKSITHDHSHQLEDTFIVPVYPKSHLSKSQSHSDSSSSLNWNPQATMVDLSKSYGPILSLPNQQASMRNLKKNTSPAKERLNRTDPQKRRSKNEFHLENVSAIKDEKNYAKLRKIPNSGLGNSSFEDGDKYEDANDEEKSILEHDILEHDTATWSALEVDNETNNDELNEEDLDSDDDEYQKPIVLTQYSDEPSDVTN